MFRYLLILMSALVIAACGGGGGGGGSTTQASGWLDSNNDGIYDPYQNQALWNDMNRQTTADAGSLLSPPSAWAAGRGWCGQGRQAPGWRDANGDGVCDYAQDPKLWSQYHTGDWIDQNGDGICDNYPDRPLDGTGRGWKNGWR